MTTTTSKSQPVFQKPADLNASIWRYMDFTKFVALLDQQVLYFSRVDRLEDKLEGSVTSASLAVRRAWFRKETATNPNRFGKTEAEFMEGYSSMIRRLSKLTFVNCWHMNTHESDAMWRLYAPSGTGVAIKSTFSKLSQSIPESPKPYFTGCGLVNYANYQTDTVRDDDVCAPFMFKRESFTHEQEIRAIIQHEFDPDPNKTDPRLPNGKCIPIQPNDLIDTVRVSPCAPHRYAILVQRVAEKFGLKKDVLQSEMDSFAIH